MAQKNNCEFSCRNEVSSFSEIVRTGQFCSPNTMWYEGVSSFCLDGVFAFQGFAFFFHLRWAMGCVKTFQNSLLIKQFETFYMKFFVFSACSWLKSLPSQLTFRQAVRLKNPSLWFESLLLPKKYTHFLDYPFAFKYFKNQISFSWHIWMFLIYFFIENRQLKKIRKFQKINYSSIPPVVFPVNYELQDFGQKDFGMKSCSGCGFVYTPCHPNDFTLHDKYHNKFFRLLKYNVSTNLFT